MLPNIILMAALPIADVQRQAEREESGNQSASASDGDVKANGHGRVAALRHPDAAAPPTQIVLLGCCGRRRQEHLLLFLPGRR